MSHTYHTTPAFPRVLRGPRGGLHRAPTPCVECVSFTSCRPGTCSAPFGCESWVDEDGRRVDLDAPLDDLAAAPLEPSREDQRDGDPYEDVVLDAPDTWDVGAHGGDRYQTPAVIALEPDPDDPSPYAPSSATLSEMSGIFPTDDNAPEPEPDTGGFTFETIGGLVKGRCGMPKPTDTNDLGPLFSGRESN